MFITIDGPDGAGKTTLTRNLVKLLKDKHGIETLYTCEPTHSETGQKIRYLAKHGGSKEEILALFLKDREEHIKNEILPELKKGKTVISDRYKYSTVCYQSMQGFEIKKLVEDNYNFLAPDISFILIADYNNLSSRIGTRNEDREIFETDDYVKKSIDIYSKMHTLFPNEKFVYINANKSPEKILKEIAGYILNFKK